jgi:hypothetical protein
MTRKDYNLIAKIIESAYYLNENQKMVVARDFADDLGLDNPRFDRDRFLVACGVK